MNNVRVQTGDFDLGLEVARLVGREGAGRIGHDPRICPP